MIVTPGLKAVLSYPAQHLYENIAKKYSTAISEIFTMNLYIQLKEHSDARL